LATHPGHKGKRRTDEDMIARSLAALTALWSRLASHSSTSSEHLAVQEDRLRRISAALAPLFGILSSREGRQALCACFSTVAALLPEELAGVDTILAGLNAMSMSEVDEADYDARMGAYALLTPEKWTALSMLAGAPLVQHCARDLRNADDLALRHAAAQALGHLVTAASTAATTVASDARESDGGGLPVAIQLIQRHLMSQLRRSVAASNLAVRQEHLVLIRRVAIALPDIYPDLLPLTSTDEETDFWLNVAHLQLHRRARALARLSRMLRDPTASSLTLGVVVGLVLPLLQQAIVEGRVVEDAGHELKQVDKDRSANVVDASVDALGAVAKGMQWTQYQQLLGQYLRLMARHGDGASAKPVLRAVCALLDAFHFLHVEGKEGNASGQDIGLEEDMGSIPDDDDEEEEEEEEEDAPRKCTPSQPQISSEEEVYGFLSRRVVPGLRDQLVSGETVRAPVAHALVKVLKLLPEARMRLELPRTLQLVANLLKLRLQRLRDDARAVLVDMSTELGPEYLPFTIEVLRSALPERGFTAHVLGYTLHAVLEGVAPAAAEEPGSIDDCLPMILPIIEVR